MGVRNTLLDLNDHLFAELERLGDEDLSAEELKKEVERAKAISSVAGNIIDNAGLVLKAEEFRREYALDEGETPRLLTGDSRDKAGSVKQIGLRAAR